MKAKTEPLAPVSPAVTKSVKPRTIQQLSVAGPALGAGSYSLPRELQQLKMSPDIASVPWDDGGAVPGEEWLTQANSQHSTQRGPSKMPSHITPLLRWPPPRSLRSLRSLTSTPHLLLFTHRVMSLGSLTIPTTHQVQTDPKALTFLFLLECSSS